MSKNASIGDKLAKISKIDDGFVVIQAVFGLVKDHLGKAGVVRPDANQRTLRPFWISRVAADAESGMRSVPSQASPLQFGL